ncbi:MAG TPA: endonuclease/exonuclease/phosphatase family protein [Thermoanaerobaculia bacterium]|jgi:endonuclease/exonuclease/phosphatase family metal-dependent hydrolase|nr:endonuclease/exonuclease/phosphatase family protein [Thermoanaerobaculia bacterium]
MADLRLKVMSYNVGGHGARWSRRHMERVAAAIAEAEPDVVGLQEVHRGTKHSRLEDQAETLALLTGLSVRFGRSFPLHGGEFGNALLTRGDVRSAEVHTLPGPGEPRTLLHSRIGLAAAEIHFYVTHLAAWGRWGRAARTVQIAGLVERLRQARGPFVLVGDLNAPPGAPEIGTLLAAELFRMCGDDVACTHRYMRQRIDYVFADPGWTTASYRVIRSGPSDHWPVLVELHREVGETAGKA